MGISGSEELPVDTASLDRDVRVAIFQRLIDDAVMPTAEVVAHHLGLDAAAAREAFQRLHAGRAIVLEPGRDDAIRMANPFSGIETPFSVEANGKRYFGNCIWDALGIPALLRADADIVCSCGDCGAPMRISVRSGNVQGDGIIHFGVPARHWWDDIIFT